MSKERDIDDILDSLNQLLREGESHNDDHVEEEASVEALEAGLHGLDEEAGGPERGSAISDAPALDTGFEVEPESNPEMMTDYDLDWEQDEGDESSDSEACSDDELVDSPIFKQRVVLTEEMLVNNPQGSLLSMASDRRPPSAEDDAVEVKPETENQLKSEEQDGEKPHALLHLDHQHLEGLLEQVADDVIHQLQRELPTLIKRSLYHRLAEIRDAEQPETDNEEHSEE